MTDASDAVVDAAQAYFEVSLRLAEALQPAAEQIDILVFDLGEAEVLYKAVSEGVLLKNDSPDC